MAKHRRKIEDVKELLEAGVNINQIAIRTNLSRVTVYKYKKILEELKVEESK